MKSLQTDIMDQDNHISYSGKLQRNQPKAQSHVHTQQPL